MDKEKLVKLVQVVKILDVVLFGLSGAEAILLRSSRSYILNIIEGYGYQLSTNYKLVAF
jgi:hypothetical protein